MKITKTLFVALVQMAAIQASFANPRHSYNAQIKCGSNNTIHNEYFSASNDMEAKNEVRRILNNNSGYSGRGCNLISLTSNKPQPSQPQRKSYEVRIQCVGSSSGSMEYFSADNDLDAENEVRRILNDRSSYKGKGCQITEMRSR